MLCSNYRYTYTHLVTHIQRCLSKYRRCVNILACRCRRRCRCPCRCPRCYPSSCQGFASILHFPVALPYAASVCPPRPCLLSPCSIQIRALFRLLCATRARRMPCCLAVCLSPSLSPYLSLFLSLYMYVSMCVSVCARVCVITTQGLFRITLFSQPLASFAVL